MSVWLTETFELSSDAWRISCALAAVCALTATVATQLHTSKNYEEHIARAQEIKATLEMLEVAITLNHLNQHEATGEYLKIIKNSEIRGVTPPTRPPKVVVPAVFTTSADAPLTVPAKLMLPPPSDVRVTLAPVRRTGSL